MSFRPPRSLPILTLFHNVKSDRSKAALTMLQNKQKNVQGEEKYRIDVMNAESPTDTQLKQIAGFLKSPTPWKEMLVVEDVGNAQDALHLLKEKPDVLRCPILVDWEKGTAAVGASTLEALEKIIDARK